MKISKKKTRVTTDGLFNDHDREEDWLIISTPSSDLELFTSIERLNSGSLNYLVTKVRSGVVNSSPGYSFMSGSTPAGRAPPSPEDHRGAASTIGNIKKPFSFLKIVDQIL